MQIFALQKFKPKIFTKPKNPNFKTKKQKSAYPNQALIVRIVKLNKGYGVFDFSVLCDCFIWL
jgi:hypothetical protein